MQQFSTCALMDQVQAVQHQTSKLKGQGGQIMSFLLEWRIDIRFFTNK